MYKAVVFTCSVSRKACCVLHCSLRKPVRSNRDFKATSQPAKGVPRNPLTSTEITMAQQPIKLHYFPLRGRAEVPRLVLHYAKKEFTDNRIAPADWGTLKPKTPFGSLPYLEVGNEAFGQSMAIASYVARESGLYGSNNIDALKIDQILQLREDLIIEEVKVWKEKDPAKNAEMTKNMNENVYPKILGNFEKLVKANQTKTGSKYAVGDKLTLADIILFEGTVTACQKDPSILDKYPAVKSVATLVAGLDGIKQYLANRAKADI
ncbi:hypothetical protein EGW08_020593 [Elysia chlorotica]|uniref:Glutathione transferase n=1 Tax=Elysia chlorotica TaxID=188477 RepID=A0A3S0Z8B1_ELYCH|nr:hypothetical protein EGW08_020593 [Elysia chlorotica]